ncbi:hypothetical protein Mal4_15930 [Maioricimonas rarisocia]|uniref:DUF480 domain-containing protein n=1 Tax=Maioricimonas rarisocia TaxID=2528026 RepID=A0A517Z470_9PLAN|nr:DUF480 domain-containing protein [Maioricimonas rarisocia]QDU37283.1 hypothetical protein Mal4_15930 [Maioricimonas rarisocia]
MSSEGAFIEGAEGDDHPEVRQLTRSQRRVLGVLVEKAFTTPDYYPLTLKALTSGCNQKSNRDPISNYTEDAVVETCDALREMGLIAVVHTESGRTERYRHYMRKRFTFTEPQLAIITELLLRGRQQLGELRSRASRMVPIDGVEELRSELSGLLEQGYIQASGRLERRGVEVDHTFYLPNEGRELAALPEESAPPAAPPAPTAPASTPSAPVAQAAPAALPPEVTERLATIERLCEELRREKLSMAEEIETINTRLDELASSVDDLRRDLGA